MGTGVTQTTNRDGNWVPAIPLPLYYRSGLFRLRYMCKCQRHFRTEEQYRGHYALVHVMGLD